MDFLNKAFSQLADLFRSMTPGARLTSGLLLAVIVVGLGYLFNRGVSGSDTYLMGGRSFPPESIQSMLGAFAKAGLTGFHADGYQIRIPAGQETKFIAALVDNDAMPRNFGETIKAAMDGNSIFDTDKRLAERLKISKQQECSQILGSVSWVAKATVLWDEGGKPAFGKDKVLTASAHIQPRNSQGLTAKQVQSIRLVVASYVAGLKPEDVTVLDMESGQAYRGDSGGMAGALDDKDIARKQYLEQDWKNRILGALSYMPGVTVETNVELDPTVKHLERQVKNDPKTVPIQTMDKSRSKSQEGAGPAGRPGYASNQPMAVQTVTTAKGSQLTDEESEQTTVNALSGTTQEIEQQPLPVKRVTATIGVPASYFEQIWQRQHPPEADAKPGEKPKAPPQNELDQIAKEQTASIQTAVAALLPTVESVADKKELVTVTVFQDIAPPAIPEPATSEKALTWLGESWRTLSLLLLVLVSLVMLRSMIRATPVERPSNVSTLAVHKPGEPEPEGSPESDTARRLRRFQSGTSLKDEVTLLVNEDPETAANILRTWIGHPS